MKQLRAKRDAIRANITALHADLEEVRDEIVAAACPVKPGDIIKAVGDDSEHWKITRVEKPEFYKSKLEFQVFARRIEPDGRLHKYGCELWYFGDFNKYYEKVSE